jgi:hypothetical protein
LFGGSFEKEKIASGKVYYEIKETNTKFFLGEIKYFVLFIKWENSSEVT